MLEQTTGMFRKAVRELARVARHQAGNARKVLAGDPLTTPPLGSATLDRDDAEMARAWLRQPEAWYDAAVTSRYETHFANWNGSEHARAFMGGRVALSAAIYALDLQPGDEVIVPGYTCIVVPNAFRYAGINPVYADIELETYGLDVRSVADKVTEKTEALLLHHLYGLVCRDYEALLDLAAHHSLKVIEDCAHATGAEFKGAKVGNYGDIAFYSSEQSKVFNTVQGGVAVTNDDHLAERLDRYHEQAPYPEEAYVDRLLHTLLLHYYSTKHPKRWIAGDIYRLRYGHKRLASTTEKEKCGIKPAHYGAKMPAPLAAIGLNQLDKIDAYNAQRRQNATRWDAWCKRRGYQKPVVVPHSLPVWLRYPVLVEPERKVDRSWAFQELGVMPGVWFISHLHPVDRYVEGCPKADVAVAQCINLPTILQRGTW